MSKIQAYKKKKKAVPPERLFVQVRRRGGAEVSGLGRGPCPA